MSRGKLVFILFLLFCLGAPLVAQAQGEPSVTFNMGESGDPEQVSLALKILFALTILTVAPTILLMTTSFVRVVIVLSFVRQAMGVRNMPPNQVIVGLALFLTIFIMSPVMQTVNSQALQPYLQEEIGEEKALTQAVEPVREFMFSHVREKDLRLLVNIADQERPDNLQDVSTMTLIPAFMISELKMAFQIGFMIFVPFLIIDMVTASVLMTMGMLMLPPVIISLPFKVLLFVLVDGWHLIVGSLVQSFH
ncbi:MAG: flagellar type III secretion system pore protein FliP [Desulfohalobiaceae bacterium]|nr:flagellar type III secretion system pore protein FliP [Desulfohalobiaceae bacterium]MCF8085600.1 flagellar type III secretion system pore protein FliP [Desulfohalobiaceae bacterium]